MIIREILLQKKNPLSYFESASPYAGDTVIRYDMLSSDSVKSKPSLILSFKHISLVLESRQFISEQLRIRSEKKIIFEIIMNLFIYLSDT